MSKIETTELSEIFNTFSKNVLLKTILGNVGFKRETYFRTVYSKKFISLAYKLNLKRSIEKKKGIERQIAYDDSGEIHLVFGPKKIGFEWHPSEISVSDLVEVVGEAFE